MVHFHTVAILALAIPLAAGADLPDGKGKDAVQEVCGECHDHDRIVRQSLTADQWSSTVREMVENGATLGSGDWDLIVNYLTRNFGPGRKPKAPLVNLNKDPAKAIAEGLKLSIVEAEAIVAYRAANGDFKSLRDLDKVTGVDVKKLAAQRELITF